jgi:hypothetical protein
MITETLVRCRVEVQWWHNETINEPVSNFRVISPSGESRIVYYDQVTRHFERSEEENEILTKCLWDMYGTTKQSIRMNGTYDIELTIDEMKLIDKMSKRKFQDNG